MVKATNLSDSAKTLLGALIGMVRGTEGNEFMLNDDTYRIIYEALNAIIGSSDDSYEDQVAIVSEEKRRFVPNCFSCGAPCGRTANYDFSTLESEAEETRTLKFEIIEEIFALIEESNNLDDKKARGTVMRALYAIGAPWSVEQLERIRDGFSN